MTSQRPPSAPLGAGRVAALLVASVALSAATTLALNDRSAAAVVAAPPAVTAAAPPAATAAVGGDTGDHDEHGGHHADHASHHADHVDHADAHADHAAHDESSAVSGVESSGTSDVASPVAAGATTPVSMGDFFFDLPPTYEAGSHTFEVVNDGVAQHEFALGAVGDHHAHFGQTAWLDAGDRETVTVELAPGTYEVGCHVPGHYEAGMTATITVLDSSS